MKYLTLLLFTALLCGCTSTKDVACCDSTSKVEKNKSNQTVVFMPDGNIYYYGNN
jgi:hypothetical protein